MIDQKAIDDLVSDYMIEGGFLHAGDEVTSYGDLDQIIKAAFRAGVSSGIVLALKELEDQLKDKNV